MRQSKAAGTSLLEAGRKLKVNGRTYEVQSFLGGGGSGEVYKVSNEGRVFAIKIFFPFYQLQFFSTNEVTRSVEESLAFQQKEYEFLSKLSHLNIVRSHDAGEVELIRKEQDRIPVKGIHALPAIVTECIDGWPLNEALEQKKLDPEQLTHVMIRLAHALEYLHAERQYMHVDIKAANILVRKTDAEPILIDFALCKNLNFAEVAKNERTLLLGDWDLFPKDLPTDHELKRLKESGGTREDLFKLAFPYLDLFQTGKLIKSLLPYWRAVVDEREFAYIDALGSQLANWNIVKTWGPRDLYPRIARIGAGHFTVFGVPELTAPTSTERTIMIPPDIAVPITRRIQRAIETRSFRRLSQMHQLCLLSSVYPGADYKRSVHLLFSYDLARRFTTHLYSSPLFRLLFDTMSCQQLLMVSLLHDINHFPFLHIFQESNIPGLDRLKVVDLFCDGVATGEKAAGQPSVYELLADVGIMPQRFKKLILGKFDEQENHSDQAISSLVNSGVDIDKLSYLFLDSYFSGVKFGTGIDYAALVKAATIGELADGRGVHLAFRDQALQAVENVVMTRCWSFRSLYWHHTNRAIMAMILHVARELYTQLGQNVEDYLRDTMWMTDFEAVKYLDVKYREHKGTPSILHGLVEDRTKLYKKLYTVRTTETDSDDEIYATCKKLDYVMELKLRAAVAGRLQTILPGGGPKIAAEDILIDVPRREMDIGGAIYISLPAGHLIPLATLSEPVRTISVNYDKLTTRVRFFVSPRIATSLQDQGRQKDRGAIQALIKDAIVEARGKSEVK